MHVLPTLSALLLLATKTPAAPAGGDPRAEADHPLLREISREVSEEELRATLTHLVGFGTRHTLSDTVSDTRGIGAARRWTAERFATFAKACEGCLEVVTPQEKMTGARMPPEGAVIQDVLAIQRGTQEPQRVIVISGHIDSRVNDVMDATSDAPGANDDGSGTAAVIEAARVLSRHRFPATLVYAVLSGEEQGLLGGKLLASHAQAQGWQVEAVLNNDIVGNTHGQNGTHVDDRVRVFSEGTRSVETPAEAAKRRYNGGEVDSPSRQLARFIEGLSRRYSTGLRVSVIYRTDRYGRGGDQVPMLEAGFPAVRVTEAVENYDRQHQTLRTEKDRVYGDAVSGVDLPYLARVTRLNALTMAALASAPPPPTEVKVEGALGTDTTLSWAASPGATRYRVWWRDTLAPSWEHAQDAGTATSAVLKGVVIDDFFFGVQALDAAGWASPVVFPGAAGSFVSPPPPPPPAPSGK